MGMVEGPFTKVEAASRCPPNGHRRGGQDPHHLRWLGGPDGGKDDGPDGAGWGTSSSLATCGSCGGTPLSGCLWPREGGRHTSTWGLAMAGAGHQVGAAQGGRHQGAPESEGPQEGLAVPGGLTEGRMVGEQGRHIWRGQCPILLGTPGSPSAQGPLRTFPSSRLELRL